MPRAGYTSVYFGMGFLLGAAVWIDVRRGTSAWFMGIRRFPVARDENPSLFWGAVAFKGVSAVACLIGGILSLAGKFSP